jgi:hypothetical protein
MVWTYRDHNTWHINSRGIILTGYPTPARPCKYWSKRCVSLSILFSASSRYNFANDAQHCRLLCCNVCMCSRLSMCLSWNSCSLIRKSLCHTASRSMSRSNASTLNCATSLLSSSCKASFRYCHSLSMWSHRTSIMFWYPLFCLEFDVIVLYVLFHVLYPLFAHSSFE